MELRLKMAIERRKNPRYCVRDNAFAVFGPQPVKLAPIIDISLGGLGIEVNGNKLCADEANCASRLEIVIDDGCFYMDNLHYQLLPQYRSFSRNAVQPFQHIYGVKFVDLMTSQQNQLKFFIRKHTRGGMTPKFIRKFRQHFHEIIGKRNFANSCQTAWLQRPSL